MTYDTVIKNATIVDGSGKPEFHADVAIKNGRIMVLDAGHTVCAIHTIDAQGLHLAPGFIDVHTHDDIRVIKAPDMLEKISQGVTTVIVGNCGISASPVTLSPDSPPPNPMNLLGTREDFQYPSFNHYIAAVQQVQPRVNVAVLVGHTALRNNVMDNLKRSASATEIQAMQQQLHDAMQNGALGLSSGLAYDNANEATPQEVMALAEVLRDYDAVYTTHLRSEFDDIIEALDEAFVTAKHGKTQLVVSHIKCAGANNWGRSGEIIAHIDSQNSLQKVACDCYPYAASSSTLDIKQVCDDYNISITWSEPHPEQAGQFLHEIAQHWGLPLVQTAQKLIPAGAVYYGMHEQDVQNFLEYHHSMVGSDGLPNDPHPHPRLWGTFPRVLGHYCRDLGLMDLPHAIHKMTGMSARNFKLHRRGLIANDYFADLVLFDLNTIQDTASFKQPIQAAQGIEKVWVNGQLSFSDNATTHIRSGQFIKRGENAHDN